MKLLLKTSYFSSFLCSVTLTNPILREISYCPPLLHIYLQVLPWDFAEVLYALVNPAAGQAGAKWEYYPINQPPLFPVLVSHLNYDAKVKHHKFKTPEEFRSTCDYRFETVILDEC
jgi:hypothetical protein